MHAAFDVLLRHGMGKEAGGGGVFQDWKLPESQLGEREGSRKEVGHSSAST